MKTLNDYILEPLTNYDCTMVNGGHPDGWGCWLIAVVGEFEEDFKETFSSSLQDGYKSARNL